MTLFEITRGGALHETSVCPVDHSVNYTGNGLNEYTDVTSRRSESLSSTQSVQSVKSVPLVRHLGRRRSLDGVRGLAWASVFCAHAGLIPIAGIGQVAMFVFFSLSGFLITALIVEEKQRVGSISLRRFFFRRALRLLPALILFLLVWFLVVLQFGGDLWMTTVPGGGSGAGESISTALQGIGAAFAYVTNWFSIFHTFSGYVPLGHLWSLAVEEQIYLIWAPLITLVLVWKRTAAMSIAVALACLSIAQVMMLSGHGQSLRVFMGTDTRAGAFLLGAAASIAWSSGRLRFFDRARNIRLLLIVSICGLVASAVPLATSRGFLVFSTAWIVATACSTTLIVAVIQAEAVGLASIFCGRLITYLGRRSYALYLWHYVWLTWLRDLGIAGVAIALICTVISAELSWHLVEKRALLLKRYFATVKMPKNSAPVPSPVLLNS